MNKINIVYFVRKILYIMLLEYYNVNWIYFLQKIGTHIKIFSKCAPQSTDRIIQIIGESAKCIETIREIVGLIKQVSFMLTLSRINSFIHSKWVFVKFNTIFYSAMLPFFLPADCYNNELLQ